METCKSVDCTNDKKGVNNIDCSLNGVFIRISHTPPPAPRKKKVISTLTSEQHLIQLKCQKRLEF